MLLQRPCSQFWRGAFGTSPYEAYEQPNNYNESGGNSIRCAGICDEVRQREGLGLEV